MVPERFPLHPSNSSIGIFEFTLYIFGFNLDIFEFILGIFFVGKILLSLRSWKNQLLE